jgi:hypothetical protein
MNRVSLAEASVTLSGVLHQTAETSHLPLTSALQLSLDVVRIVAEEHDKGRVIGVLDAAHLICRDDGRLKVGGSGGDPIAPELQRGDKPDRLSDVYALGALVYRLLTGRKVNPRKLIEPPSHFNPAVDSELDDLVLQALDEDPSERPYSARELEQRLSRIMEDLGLEPSKRDEASALLTKSVAKYRSPVRFSDAEKTEDDDEDDDDLGIERPQGFGGFLYDLGWSPGKPQRSAFVARRNDEDGDDEPRSQRGKVAQFIYDLGFSGLLPQKQSSRTPVPLGADDDEDAPRRRNKLSQFFYDLGWFQNIDWDSPVTLMWLKRGGIAVGVLFLLVMVWPSHKKAPKADPMAALAAQVVTPVKAKPLPVEPNNSPKVKLIKTASRH